MPRMNASAIAVYDSTENSSVTFTLIPAAIASSMAGTPASVPGILIIEIRAVHTLPVLVRLLERGVGVVREGRLDLERDEAVRVVRLVPDRPQHVAGELHVQHRDLVVDLARGQALGASSAICSS